MRIRSLGDAFRAVMSGSGWSGARLARETGTSQPYVSMVLSGKRDPGIARSAEMLAKVGWQLYAAPAGEEEPVDRRSFLVTAVTVALVPGPGAGASPYTSAEWLDQVTARLERNEGQLGGAPLAAEAARHAARAATAAQAAGPAVQAAAARLLLMCALIAHDVRRLGQAEEIAVKSLRFARSAGDLAAQAAALSALSMITAHLSDGRGARYAQCGLALPETGSRALLSARLGRALALSPGHRVEARHWLETALEHCGSGAEISGNAGIGLADAGLPGLGEQHLAEAARLTAGEPFLHSLWLARLAKAGIRARQPEQVAQEIMRLAVVVPLIESPRLAVHLRHIMDGTARWDQIARVRTARQALREAMT